MFVRFGSSFLQLHVFTTFWVSCFHARLKTMFGSSFLQLHVFTTFWVSCFHARLKTMFGSSFLQLHVFTTFWVSCFHARLKTMFGSSFVQLHVYYILSFLFSCSPKDDVRFVLPPITCLYYILSFLFSCSPKADVRFVLPPITCLYYILSFLFSCRLKTMFGSSFLQLHVFTTFWVSCFQSFLFCSPKADVRFVLPPITCLYYILSFLFLLRPSSNYMSLLHSEFPVFMHA